MSNFFVDADALAVFERQMRLCQVKPDETVVVLNAPGEQVEHVNALLAAIDRLGARSMHVSVPRSQDVAAAVMGRHPLSGHALALETCKKADMVVDLMGLLFSAEQLEIQAAGTRILRVAEPLHILKQMAPTLDLRRRCEYARNLILKSKRLRIKSKHGTDVLYELSQYGVVAEYGYTDEPGRWDHFPSGFVFTQGNDGGVNGQVVLAPGDIICAFKRYVESPVTFTIEKGYITRIVGEGASAELIRNYIDSFGDPRGFAIAHIGFGLNERARWDQFAAARDVSKEYIMNALSFHGNVLFSTGPNSEFGGDNDTPCHMDLPMRGCSLWLDDLQILDKGKAMVEELRVSGEKVN